MSVAREFLRVIAERKERLVASLLEGTGTIEGDQRIRGAYVEASRLEAEFVEIVKNHQFNEEND